MDPVVTGPCWLGLMYRRLRFAALARGSEAVRKVRSIGMREEEEVDFLVFSYFPYWHPIVRPHLKSILNVPVKWYPSRRLASGFRRLPADARVVDGSMA